jgi:hypothetical protein
VTNKTIKDRIKKIKKIVKVKGIDLKQQKQKGEDKT